MCCRYNYFFFYHLATTLFLIAAAETIAPRHCHGSVKHLHLAVGPDPARSMTVSFASQWAFPDRDAPLGGIHVGTSPDRLNRFVPEQELPLTYTVDMHIHKEGQSYYAPYQHHITVDGLEPDTTYYYVAVLGNREDGIDALKTKPFRASSQQQQQQQQQYVENIQTEGRVYYHHGEVLQEGVVDVNGGHRRFLMSNGMKIMKGKNDDEPKWDKHGRRLAPPAYDPTGTPCIDGYTVRSFKTAPLPGDEQFYPMAFGIIGDIGQFEHSIETLEHMKHHLQGIQAVILVGDIAYSGTDGRKWDTFFDFLDDHSPFDTIPLMIAPGNHDIDKQPNRKEIFLAYEYRFRMPRVHPPELGVYEGDETQEDGALNMDAPPYPLPYEWGNAYYAFTYGPARHVIVSAYSDMSPGSTQYTWLEEELSSVDRKRTPWVFLTLHVPIYNTFALHHHDPQIFAAREHLEPLLVKYHVNLVLNGHIHAYQRTKNVALNQTTPTGPIHVTIGAGGRACDAPFQNEVPESWIAQRDASMYGYGRVTLFNKTHAEWKWVKLSASEEHHYNEVKGEGKLHLPSLDHDKLIVENQYHISKRREKEEVRRRQRRLHKVTL